MMNRYNLIAFLAVAIVAIGAAYCAPVNDTRANGESIRQVNWIEVNPPPGVEGPCWAYFEARTGYHGYSGVWCE